MDFLTLALFLPTAALVCAAPGPSTLLVLAHATSRDARRPAALIAGAVSANAVMVMGVAFGLGAVIGASQTALFVLKLAGGFYLIWLGASYLRSAADPDAATQADERTYRVLAGQAFLTSITNQKGLVFYLAFLPQFVTPTSGFAGQTVLYGLLYTGVFALCLVAYAMAGHVLGTVALSERFVRLKNRVLGAALIASGAGVLRWSQGKT